MKIHLKLMVLFYLIYPYNAAFLPYGLYNGDRALGYGDDISYEISTSQPIKFWDTMMFSFYVSTNGGIFSSAYTSPNPNRNWSAYPEQSLLVYYADAHIISGTADVFARTTISSNDADTINSLLQQYDDSFNADRDRTLIVTWFNAPGYHETTKKNTFQAVIASNGITTYTVISYDKLEYYERDNLAKVGFKSTDSKDCSFPESRIEPIKLRCRSNVCTQGLFVVGLTPTAQFQCNASNILPDSADVLPCLAATNNQPVNTNVELASTVSPIQDSSSYFYCDFEHGTCGVTGIDDFYWKRHRGGTGSSNTGPNVDASGSTLGYYVYREASQGASGSVHSITIPLLNIEPTSAYLKFAYHMYGSYIGRLVVKDPSGNVLWEVNGNRGNEWNRATVRIDLSTPFFSVIFETRLSLTGDTYTGDIALDDISISNSSSVFYPYGSDNGDFTMKYGDSLVESFYLNQSMPLFSKNSSQVYISTNGFVSFNTPSCSFGSYGTCILLFPLHMETSSLNGGNIYYRQTQNTEILARADSDVNRLGNRNFQATTALVITYINVPQWNRNSQTHTFQLILPTDGKISYAIVNYFHLAYSGNIITGFSETSCNNGTFAPRHYAQSLTITSNVGVIGRHVHQLTNLDCFIPVTGVVFWQTTSYLDPPFDTQRFNLQLISSRKHGSIAFSAVEVINSFSSSAYLKKTSKTYQEFSFFFPNKYTTGTTFRLMAVFDGSPTNASFQFGKINVPEFSSELACTYQSFDISMQVIPSIKLVVDIGSDSHEVLRQTYAWLNNVTRNGFSVCYKEAYTFSDSRNITIHYIAVANSTDQFKEHGNYIFSKDSIDSCARVPLKYTYIRAPSVFITPVEIPNQGTRGPLHSWIKKIGTNYVEICAKSSTDGSIAVNYVVGGKIGACTNYQCPSHLECRVTCRNEPFCGCISYCSNTTSSEVFCGTDFVNYQSQCHLDKLYCENNGNQTKSNTTLAHHGKCERFPFQSGVAQLDPVGGISVAFCKYIILNRINFHSSKELHVQLTVSWNAQHDSNKTNDAMSAWSEQVTIEGFKACVIVAGRHFSGGFDTNPSIYWFAYQDEFMKGNGMIEGGVINFSTWYTGGRCEQTALKYNHYNRLNVQTFVSVEHTTARTFENAMTAWVEGDISRVCVREFQNFDGKHEGIRVHWLVIYNEDSLFISTRETVSFPRRYHSPGDAIPAVCKDIEYNTKFPSLPNPTVLITGSIPPATSNYSTFSSNGLTSWIESISDATMKLCYKTIRTDEYMEEVKIYYMILPTLCEEGWEYISGSCYKNISGCHTYNNAKQQCNAINATLPTVETSSEEYYLEQNSKLSQTWIGLTDAANETDWIWESGSNSTYRKWLMNKPDGGPSKNCAVVDGSGNMTGWNDVSCNSCVSVQCEKDTDLISRSCGNFCQNGGSCIASGYQQNGDVTNHDEITLACMCPSGFIGTRCQMDLTTIEECSNYTLHTESWRRFSKSNSQIQPNSTSCDAQKLSNNGWHRFSLAAGTQLLDNCTQVVPACGTRSPGWLVGSHPTVNDGIVTRYLRYFTYYCADDHGEVQIRNCGNFYTYKFVNIPYWSCQYGVCTMA